MVLPPINPSVLERNPRFKTLYQDLANSRLNQDASTRLIKQQRDQAEVEKALQIYRKENAKSLILKDALAALSRREDDLPPELLQSCKIVTAMLNGHLPPTDASILSPEIDYFIANLPRITSHLTTHLTTHATSLHALLTASPPPPPSSAAPLDRDPAADLSSLASHTAALQARSAGQAGAQTGARAALAARGAGQLAWRTGQVDGAVRVLEQTLHGSVARGVRARAEHLCAVARGVEGKLGVLETGGGEGRELRKAVDEYGRFLSGREDELRREVDERVGELGRYARVGKGMERLVERYVELKGEEEGLRREIERLERGKGEDEDEDDD